MLLLWRCLVWVKCRLLDPGGCVVAAALAVLVWLWLEVVLALSVFAGGEADGAGEWADCLDWAADWSAQGLAAEEGEGRRHGAGGGGLVPYSEGVC